MTSFYNFFKKIFIILNIFISRTTNINDLHDFIFLIKSNFFYVDLIRIGSPNDGGYLFPLNLLDKFDLCVSLGIGDNYDFERELSNSGKYIYGVDGSIEYPLEPNIFENFISLYAASYSDDNSLEINNFLRNLITDDKKFILKIDIEGDEYQVISNISEELLKQSEVIIVEFHHLDSLFTSFGHKIISSVFNKLLKYFIIAHIHPNNISIVLGPKGARIPNILEITFLNRRHKSNTFKIKSIPHDLDAQNIINKKNVVLPIEFWGI